MDDTEFYTIPLDDDPPDEHADPDWVTVDPRYDAPNTPSSTGDEAVRHESTDAESDEDENARSQGELVPRTKPGGYDSRVEQMLYENPELPILIIDAAKSQESGRYIVYTIKTGVRMGSGCSHVATDTDRQSPGTYSASPLFRVRIPARCPYEATPDPHHTSDPREAHHGRLCREPHQREAGPADNRSPKTHACCLLEPMPEDGASPDRRCLVEVFGSQLKLGKSDGKADPGKHRELTNCRPRSYTRTLWLPFRSQ